MLEHLVNPLAYYIIMPSQARNNIFRSDRCCEIRGPGKDINEMTAAYMYRGWGYYSVGWGDYYRVGIHCVNSVADHIPLGVYTL